MSNDESLSPGVRVFMTEIEAQWHKFEHGFSQQGSSSEGNFWVDVPSAGALSHTGAGPSGRVTEAIDSNETEEVYSEEPTMGKVSPDHEGVEPVIESQPSEGMLLNNPKSSMSTAEVKLWRYLYKIPPSVEIRVPSAHERVDWVVPSWVVIYELMLKDRMRFSIPKLIRDVCDH